MRWSTRTLLLTAALTATLAVGSYAHAQDARLSLEDIQAQAAEAYQRGDYKKAISFMLQANGLSPHPNYLLNIAVAYSKLGDCENARLFAQNAIDARDPALPEEAVATARAVQNDCETLQPDPDKVAVQPDPNPPITTPPPQPIAWRPITAYSLLGGGAIFSLASIFLDLKIGKDLDDLQAEADDPMSGLQDDEFDQRKDDIQSQQTLVTAGYIVGGLLVAGGATLLVIDLLDTPQDANAPQARLTPWLAPDAAGLLLDASF